MTGGQFAGRSWAPVRRVHWTAGDVQQLRELAASGLPSTIIAELMQPPTTAGCVRTQARRHQIPMQQHRRPTNELRRHWESIREAILADRAEQQAAREALDGDTP